MKHLILGADHAGFALKESLKPYFIRLGFSLEDETPVFIPGDDYPPIAKRVAKRIARDQGTGLLICGSGYGMDIAANRIKGVRASVVHSSDEARRARQDDHANIIILGARMTSLEQARKIIQTWFKTKPIQAVRHLRRIQMLDA